MESLYLLIPLALLFIAIALRVFFWAVKSGQFDDLDTEGKRILFDDVPLDSGDAGSDSELELKAKPSSKPTSMPNVSNND